MRALSPLLALSLALSLAGCATTEGPRYFLLDPSDVATPDSYTVAGPAVGLREIDLPDYARRPEIATLEGEREVVLSDVNRWAEEPARAASRLLARALEARLGRPVVVEPWPREIDPTLLLDIQVDRLIGTLGGDVRLVGRFRVSPVRGGRGGAGGTDTVGERFDLTVPLGAADDPDGYPALVEGQSRALLDLAERIARAVEAVGS